jgi:hypothetical protein
MNRAVKSVKTGRHGRANEGETVKDGLAKAPMIVQNDDVFLL